MMKKLGYHTWISVHDVLPQLGKRVDIKRNDAWRTTGILISDNQPGGFWWVSTEGLKPGHINFSNSEPTHWRPRRRKVED